MSGASRVAYLNKVLAGLGSIPEQGTSGYGDKFKGSAFPSVGRPPLVRGACGTCGKGGGGVELSDMRGRPCRGLLRIRNASWARGTARA